MKLLAGAVVRKRPSNEPSPPSKKANLETKDSVNESSDETKPEVKSDSESSKCLTWPYTLIEKNLRFLHFM